MLVYRESQPPTTETILGLWLYANDDLSFKAVRTCRGGAKALTLMMQDLKVQLELRTNIDVATVNDAIDLITVVSFFLFGPLIGILKAMHREDKRLMYNKSFYKCHKAMSTLLKAVSEAQDALNTIQTAQTVQEVELMEIICLSKKRYFTEAVRITPISPIELLLRIVTARKRWDSLGMIPGVYT
jgi:hypothetical protein